jgi:hypothetical protein
MSEQEAKEGERKQGEDVKRALTRERDVPSRPAVTEPETGAEEPDDDVEFISGELSKLTGTVDGHEDSIKDLESRVDEISTTHEDVLALTARVEQLEKKSGKAGAVTPAVLSEKDQRALAEATRANADNAKLLQGLTASLTLLLDKQNRESQIKKKLAAQYAELSEEASASLLGAGGKPLSGLSLEEGASQERKGSEDED